MDSMYLLNVRIDNVTAKELLDTYHDIKAEFLQLYLNEFCYKFNRASDSLTGSNFAHVRIGRTLNIEFIDWQLADIHFVFLLLVSVKIN